MTVSTSSSQTTVAGNGATTVFQFGFVAVSNSNIQVTYTDANGNRTVLGSSQYSISLNAAEAGQIWGAGGTVTYPLSGNAIAAGTTLTIQRILPLTQGTTVGNQGDFYPEAVEQAIDTLCMEIQQISARSGLYRGYWATSIGYNTGDMVVDGVNGADTGNYYSCNTANTSGTWAADLASGYWTLQINVQGIVANVAAAAASAAAAGTSATAAALSASQSSGSAVYALNEATSAAASATSAAASATSATVSATSAATSATTAAAQASALSGTSATSLTVGLGAQTLTTQSGKYFGSGWVTLQSSGTPTATMTGTVTSYSGTTLVVNVTYVTGSGAHADWVLSVAGAQGAPGATGPSGSIASGAAGGTADILAVTVSGATATAGQLIAVICSAANATSTPTLALNSGAAVPITAQGGKSGWANMIPGALFVGIFEYSTSNTWEILNPVTSFTPLSVTTAYSAGQKDAFKEIRSTAATTVTFAQTTMLSPSWSQSYFAQGGAIVFTPNASDQINGGTAGAAVTAPQGSYGFINTDGAGNLWISGVLGSAAFLPVATTATANAVVETNSGGTIDPSFVKGALSVTSVKSAGTTSTTGFTIATGDDLTAIFATITEVNTAQATANTGVSNASSAQTSANNAQNTANAAYSLAASKWTPSVNTSTSGSAGPSIWQFALTWNGVTIGLAGVNCDCNCNCGG